jgi:hypothetical protein
VLPVLRREVIEREQGLAVLCQAVGGFVILRLILGEEAIERRLGLGSACGLGDGVEIGLGLTLSTPVKF